MQKLIGWTKNPFVGCDKCKEEGRIVCQASRYRIHKVKGSSESKTTHYCTYHEDLADPPERRLERKRKKELERANERVQSDDSEREWYHISGAHKYI